MKEVSGDQFQRFYVVLVLLIVGLLLFPLLPIGGLASGRVQQIQASYLVLMMGLIAVGTGWAAIQAQRHAVYQIDHFHQRGRDTLGTATTCLSQSERLHIVVLALYREPFDLVALTIRSLADQPEAERIILAVGIEEDAPKRDDTIADIKNAFGHSFRDLFVYIHPKGVLGEIAGKCSNLNHAARAVVADLEAMSVDLRDATLTSCDADNVFDCNYFGALEACFVGNGECCSTSIWQAAVLYSWSPGLSPFFTVVTGALRSVWITGVLAPLSINGMSVFSMGLDLYRRAGYTSPVYQMEDILSVVRWSLMTGKIVKITPLPAALLSGPTSGRNRWDHFDQWRQQIRRWTCGAAEVFVYALYHVRFSSLPWPCLLPWALRFFLYYFVVQCVAPLSICLGLLRGFLSDSRFFDVLPLGMSAPLGSVIAMWLCSLVVVVVLLARAVVFLDRSMALNAGQGEAVWLVRLLPLPMVLVMYAFVVFEGLALLAARGKSACQHNPSEKDFLSTKIHRLQMRLLP